MKCRQCGTSLEENANYCVKCGSQVGDPKNICKKCGSVLLPDALYCNKCGEKIERNEILHCSSCGKQIVNSSLFCEYCGAKVLTKSTNPIEETQAATTKGKYHYKLTEEPILLPSTTNGTLGDNQTYVLFGDWPQSKKGDDVIIVMKSTIINNIPCFLGSDNNYYSPQDIDKNLSDTTWLKLEPIKWRVINTNNSEVILVSEKILFFKEFNTKINYAFQYEDIDDFFKTQKSSLNNYKCSSLRQFLNSYKTLPKSSKDIKLSNEGFLNCAFTKKAQKLIQFTEIKDKNKDSLPYEDKVFLLSHDDFKESYSLHFRDYRVRQADKEARWWLRDAYGNLNMADCVDVDGVLRSCEEVTNTYGIVPVIKLGKL